LTFAARIRLWFPSKSRPRTLTSSLAYQDQEDNSLKLAQAEVSETPSQPTSWEWWITL
jgi:hypothetical protein